MFLAEEKRRGKTNLVFTWEDPRKDGFQGNVIENVALDYDMKAVHSWLNGQGAPDACVGRDPRDPQRYKVFKYCAELQSAGYQAVPGKALVFGSWSDYVRLRMDPPDPDQTEPEAWYEYQDILDEDARRWRERAPEPDLPADKSRDAVAEWVARKYKIVDSGIREILYLPTGAGANEIRLLVVNDRFVGAEDGVDALESPLRIDDSLFHVHVADVSSEQLAKIAQDPVQLPQGWSLADSVRWRRGA